jgi:CHAT domain-containing protein
MALGCKRQPEQSISARYAEAYSKLQSGELEGALKSSGQGFQETLASDPVWNYKFRVLKAEALAGLGRASDSLDALKADPPPPLAGSEFAVRRRIIQSRALCRLGNYNEANLLIGDAEQQSIANSPELQGEIALFRGTCLLSQNATEKAQASLVEALTFARHHKQPLLEVNALGTLGWLSMELDRFDEAIDRLRDALALAHALNARRAEEKILGNIGFSFFELGDFPNARSNTMQAEALAVSLDNADDQRRWLMNLGAQYLAQKNYDDAAAAYSHALDLVMSLNNKEDTAAGDCLHDLAQIELGRHNLPRAEEYNQRVAAMGGNKPDNPLHLPYLLTTAEIAVAKGDRGNAEDLLKQITGDKNADVSLRWQAQTDLADLYVNWGKTAEAGRSFRDAIHTVEAARSVITHVEQRLSFLDAGPFYDGYVRFLIDQGSVTRAMEVAEYSRARTLVEGLGIDLSKSRINLQQPQRALRQKEVILVYWLSDKESSLWAVTPAGTKLFRLPQKRDIDQAVESYNKQIHDRLPLEDSPSGSTLYNMLVKPVESLFPKASHVTIIPHGSLYRLNFETLIVPSGAPHYWIDDVIIENTSSMSFRFSAQRHADKPQKQLLLIGDPIQASPEYPRLKHAAEEIRSVAKHFSAGQTALISDKAATPDAYFATRPEDYRFIDFVTHGTGAPLNPLDSAIVLSPDKDVSYKLYARDVIKKPIHAEIVTVSACYGAGGRTYSGEGLVGLAWAFMRAGAHHVVAALWEAEDAVTPGLMDDFYSGLESGKSAVDALRAAKIKMLHSGGLTARPYYWASLQLYTGS